VEIDLCDTIWVAQFRQTGDNLVHIASAYTSPVWKSESYSWPCRIWMKWSDCSTTCALYLPTRENTWPSCSSWAWPRQHSSHTFLVWQTTPPWHERTPVTLNGHPHYPNDLDKPLIEAAADRIRKYRADYNQNPQYTISFMPTIVSTSGRLHSEFVRILFLQDHRETDRFFAVWGVQFAQHHRGGFHYRHTSFSSLN
jgi:hypothetical protein